MTPRFAIGQTAIFRYKFGYRRNGKNYWPKPWAENLILDSGLNKVATIKWQDCWSTCLFGNQVAPDPVRRDSLATTFTVVGTTCTATASFFLSTDTGRLIKFNDANGQEFYLTFVSATVATLSAVPSPAITAQSATVWYVNQTALQSLSASTGAYQQNGGDNSTVVAANIVTYKRTFLGSALGAPVTFTEIGFSDNNSNVNIFDRDIITGGVSLTTGDQPLAIAQLILTVTPASATAVGNVATGYDSSGSMVIAGLNVPNVGGATPLSLINANGSTGGNINTVLEPNTVNNGDWNVYPATFTLPAFSNGAGPNLGATVTSSSVVNQGYSAGTFFRDAIFSYPVSSANGSIFGCGIGPAGQIVWVQKFTTSFVKTSAQTLNFTFRKFWQRNLVN